MFVKNTNKIQPFSVAERLKVLIVINKATENINHD